MRIVHFCIAAIILCCSISGSQPEDTTIDGEERLTNNDTSSLGEGVSGIKEESTPFSDQQGTDSSEGVDVIKKNENQEVLDEEMEKDILTVLQVPHNLLADVIAAEETTELLVSSQTVEENSIITAVTGGIEQLPRIVTFHADNTKIRRCIYGCDTVTVSETGTITSTTVVTIIPVTVPCSLVVCPPCGCTTKILSVTGCPVITTTTPSDSTLTVTADVTITFVTVTETITDCSITTCPTQVTVTVTDTPSRTTITQFSTEQIFVTPTTTSSSISIPTGPPIVTIDPGCPCGYNEDPVEEEEEEQEPCGCDIAVTTTTACNCPNLHYFKAAPAPLNVNNFVKKDKKDDHQTQKEKKKNMNKSCKPCTAGQHFVIQGTSVTVTTSQILAPTTRTITGEVCSTFIVCNPKNFLCPASSQVTNAKQFASFLASTSTSSDNSLPSELISPPSYVGFDGKEHPVAYNSPFIPQNNGEVHAGGGQPIKEEAKNNIQVAPPRHSGEAQRNDVKGQKILTPNNFEKNNEDGKMKAASVKNGSWSLKVSHSLILLPLLILFLIRF